MKELKRSKRTKPLWTMLVKEKLHKNATMGEQNNVSELSRNAEPNFSTPHKKIQNIKMKNYIKQENSLKKHPIVQNIIETSLYLDSLSLI
ncbi:hypothetical protein AYI68_g934 [Smittium mucronatum]|uniref:Uncharacterized protein n=1 Tax=Smittium mucronatum TaxID=133383 RepID=A0A1R0H700_9FUNG|nr:hypothetical protein AYI68_g934 [Smittium mucronatum]